MNLQKIADELGVSRSTVSRALRGDERISIRTRKRVSETANTLGYRSNPYLSILMAKLREGAMPSASPIIALINPNNDTRRAKSTFLHTYRGASKRAEELGFSLEEFHIDQSGMTATRLKSILLARNIRAAIMASDPEEDPEKAFDFKGFATVNLSTANPAKQIHSVRPDFLGNTFKAIKELRKLGYQRIGLALESKELTRMRGLPRMAFLEHEHTLPASERIGFWSGPNTDLHGFASWLGERRPDAIITSDWLPQKWIQPLGLRIPEDIGIAQLDPNFFPFQNSGIEGRFEKIGAAAVDMVVSQIAANNYSLPEFGNTTLIEGVWRNGWSTRDKTADNLRVEYSDAANQLLNTARLESSPELDEVRRASILETENKAFDLTTGRNQDSWQHVSISSIANSPYEAPAWPPIFNDAQALPPLQGLRQIRGVYFQFPSKRNSLRNTCLCLYSKGQKERVCETIQIDPTLRIQSIYFCHLSFYGWYGDPIAGYYKINYKDGSSDTIKLKTYNPPDFPVSQATHQDSWTAHPQFESDRCKSFLLPSPSRPFEEDRYGYVLEYRLPQSAKAVESITVESNPKSDTLLLLTAISLLIDPN